jgi:glycosyltransferase involved in cell wall biosynthesis
MRNAGRKVLPVLVGDGPARAECEAGMPGAIFAGTRRGEELAAHYASADLFVFASLTETFGNVTAEAMASGLPVVAFDHAAAGLLVEHGFNGFKAHPSDHHGFVRAAVQAMAHRAHLPAMGRHARVTACAHGWPRIVDEIEAVMRGAMRAARPLPAPRLAPMSS